MKQYISKDALVVELNRLIAELVEGGEDTMFEQGRISAFEDVKVFINHTLEVKEINSTDVFIEKACEWIETNMDDYIHVEYDTVTGRPTNEAHIAHKKVVEDFKKYMKGESLRYGT